MIEVKTQEGHQIPLSCKIYWDLGLKAGERVGLRDVFAVPVHRFSSSILTVSPSDSLSSFFGYRQSLLRFSAVSRVRWRGGHWTPVLHAAIKVCRRCWTQSKAGERLYVSWLWMTLRLHLLFSARRSYQRYRNGWTGSAALSILEQTPLSQPHEAPWFVCSFMDCGKLFRRVKWALREKDVWYRWRQQCLGAERLFRHASFPPFASRC